MELARTWEPSAQPAEGLFLTVTKMVLLSRLRQLRIILLRLRQGELTSPPPSFTIGENLREEAAL